MAATTPSGRCEGRGVVLERLARHLHRRVVLQPGGADAGLGRGDRAGLAGLELQRRDQLVGVSQQGRGELAHRGSAQGFVRAPAAVGVGG
jgi:hypothetical protein